MFVHSLFYCIIQEIQLELKFLNGISITIDINLKREHNRSINITVYEPYLVKLILYIRRLLSLKLPVVSH